MLIGELSVSKEKSVLTLPLWLVFEGRRPRDCGESESGEVDVDEPLLVSDLVESPEAVDSVGVWYGFPILYSSG